MATLKAVLAKKTTLKARLTRYTNNFKKYESEDEASEINLKDVQHVLNTIQPFMKEFDETYQKILEFSDDQTDEEEYGIFEDAHRLLKCKLELYLEKHTVISPSPVSDANPPSLSNASVFQLPSINLPQFNGEFENWLEFRDAFQALIHNNSQLSNIQKFYYLISSVKGDAALCLKSLQISAENYTVAWELLTKRFENKKLIVQTNLKALFNLDTMKRDCHATLQKFLDDVLKITKSLKVFEQPTKDLLLIYIISAKFSTATRREWELFKTAGEFPTFEELVKFLDSRCHLLGSLEVNKDNSVLFNKEKFIGSKAQQHNVKAFTAAVNHYCAMCKGSHYLSECEKFANLSVDSRISEVRRLQICLNCLRGNHLAKDCRSKYTCRTCKRRHHSLLHIVAETKNVPSTNEGKSETKAQSLNTNANVSVETPLANEIQNACTTHANQTHQTLLSTVSVIVQDNMGIKHVCRALLDPGSQINFITTALCNKLGLTKSKSNLTISGISAVSTPIVSRTYLKVHSRTCSYAVGLTCSILDKITNPLPGQPFSLIDLKIPENLKLADPECHIPGNIDILIGAGIFWDLLCIGQHKLGVNMPVLQKTKFGWVIGGDYVKYNVLVAQTVTSCSNIMDESLDNQLTRFWEIEECNTRETHYSTEELFCENHFISNTKRDATGRFVVKLPLLESPSKLGNSRTTAIKCLKSLERKLSRDNSLKVEYTKFLEEYEDLGHMTKINEQELRDPRYYLPHHAVVKDSSSTTKVRVVFNASARTDSGNSLNDLQGVGPTIQNELFVILIRFRKHSIVMKADIAKMYRQVLIAEEQRPLQLIVWRKRESEPISCYQLNTVTYGTSAAPFLAIRCLKQLAIENSSNFPEASQAIETDFYVDDYLGGSDTVEQALQLQQELTEILKGGNFELRKWSSNSDELLNNLSVSDNIEQVLVDISGNSGTKTLGLSWNPSIDCIQYEIKPLQSSNLVTKRSILSAIAQIYDPLGLIGPVIIIAKLIMQNLWQLKLSWDESIPLNLYTKWSELRDNLELLNSLRIPRYLFGSNLETIELHGFSDASEAAYGACVYARCNSTDKKCTVSLICSKSRVAPLKTISLPRLELCGALLLAKLMQRVKCALDIKSDNCYYWSDSTITISWIKSPPTRWKTFVANRVAKIQVLSKIENWRHVKSQDNPADAISRGIQPNRLYTAEIWWHGPNWLKLEPNLWPKPIEISATQIPEMKSTTAVVANVTNSFSLLTKYSSLSKVQRVTAYCLRFIKNTRVTSDKRNLKFLSTEELEIALWTIVKLAQAQAFPSELSKLKGNNKENLSGSLNQLRPFLDDKDLMRVGGRLEHSELSFDKRHPVILPRNHTITRQMLQHEHVRLLHCGPTMLLASIRDRFWPIGGRQAARKIVHDCVTCFRNKPKFFSPIMGHLPTSRISPAPAFYNTGLDYAGPIMIKTKDGRGAKLIKSYFCIFICMVTKAMHLELVQSLSTEAFLAALQRFIGRRGKPANIHSDNGTNFVGASAELRKFLAQHVVQQYIAEGLAKETIAWHFSPPRAPHFGGVWEAGVKSVKHHLKRVIGNSHLTYEQMYTVLIQVECILNSRPLTPLSSDPNDLDPLTPAHFLVGRKLTAIPEANYSDVASSRLSKYQQIQKCVQHFWKRWNKEYLGELQSRTKWTKNHSSTLKVGSLVLFSEDNTPPLKWPLGRVVKLHPGPDGITRVVSVQNANKAIVKRAVVKICVLPIDC